MESSEIKALSRNRSDSSERFRSSSQRFRSIVIQISAIQIGLSDSYLKIEIEGHLSDSDRLLLQRFKSISAIQIGDSSERFRSSLSKSKSKFISAIQIGRDRAWTFQWADVNLKNDGSRTALHYAASKGWLKITEILLSHGAKINLKDKVGCTPLHLAASTGNSELCEFLIEEGAGVDAIDKATSENAFKGIPTSLPKARGGEFGKFYSLLALNDPRIVIVGIRSLLCRVGSNLALS
ncbi:hypothetical protein ACSBR1_027517 [Camellia fascicularis]